MNKVNQNGVSVKQSNGTLIYNGKKYPVPKKAIKSGQNNMVIVNGKVIVNGYRFNPETGTFSKVMPVKSIILIAVVALALYFLYTKFLPI